MKFWALTISALLLVHSPDAPFADWMASLQRPDVGGSCCGPSDQVYVDDYRADPDGDGFLARIAGEDVHVPASKVIWDRVNPTGRGVLFWMAVEFDGSRFVYCFVPGTGT